MLGGCGIDGGPIWDSMANKREWGEGKGYWVIGLLVEPCLASLSGFIMTKDVGIYLNFANVISKVGEHMTYVNER